MQLYAYLYSLQSMLKNRSSFTFILRSSYLVFGFTLLSFPLNRCTCLTITVYIL